MMLQDNSEIGPNRVGDNYDRYVQNRLGLSKNELSSEKLLEIQEDIRAWATRTGILDLPLDYLSYDQVTVDKKIGELLRYLSEQHGGIVTSDELDVTSAFIDCAFDMYFNADRKIKDGSFAFVAPARVSRDYPEYGREVEHVIPALRFVPNELRAHFMVGLPPFVIDSYGRDSTGHRGYVVFCPTYLDMIKDIPADKLADSFTKVVNDTINFCQSNLGVKVAGLAAILPRLTGYGSTISNKDIAITTGHGGTTYLIEETMKRAAREGLISRNSLGKIGIIGLGSIGISIADIIAGKFPDSEIHVFDERQERIALAKQNGRSNIISSSSIKELLSKCGVSISAVTSKIELGNILDGSDVEGHLVIDDSQPGSFDPVEVESLGGKLVWPIASSRITEASRTGYDYATLLNARNDLFGCEAEAASLGLVMRDMREGGKSENEIMKTLHALGIRRAVDSDQVNATGERLKSYGFGAAELQAFGQSVDS